MTSLGYVERAAKVVRVTAQEFELSDGRVYPHPVELDPVPTTAEFQRIYERVTERLKSNEWLGLDSEGR